jgi:hypothetical protein|tara:strand:+ start:23950 stop:24780 length:831 start_codon:yes stop_codon:yes gene_type:complete
MAFIRFTKLPIQIDGDSYFATDATFSESLPLTRINALGYKGAVAVAATGPVDGTWNVSMTYTAGMTKLLDTFKKDWGDRFHLVFGGSDFGKTAIMTSLNVQAEANGVATVSCGGNVYGSLGAAILEGAETELTPASYVAVGHGSKTEVVGFNSEYFNFSWAASRTLTSIYKLNSADPVHLDFSDENITASAQGSNLQRAITSSESAQGAAIENICPMDASLTFKVSSMCAAGRAGIISAEEWVADGYVQDRNVEVTVNDVLRGNITIVDYYSARTN